MFVRLLRDWRGYRLGRLLDVTDGVAGVLIRRGLAAQAGGAPATAPEKPAPAKKPRSKEAKKQSKRGKSRLAS